MFLDIITTVGVAVLIGFAVTTAANAATTVYLHRCLSHRALSLRAPASLAFRTILWLATGIKPRQWVAVHRKHHAYADEAGDPHSPVLLGWRRVQVGNVALYREALSDPDLITKYAKDLPPDRWDRAFFDRQWVGLGSGVAILMVVFGPVVGLLAAFAHANMYLAGSAAVNAIGHHFGRRRYENKATNLQWLALLTMGEGLHNNHHAAPSSPRLAHRWYEVDLGWWVINALRLLRLAKVRFADIRLSPVSGAPVAGS